MTIKNSHSKPIILILCSFYLPGYKSGGGMRTLANMVERFNNRFDFRVITQDHDLDEKPYNDVKINDWNQLNGAKVYYLSKDKLNIQMLRNLIKEVAPDSIYVNSIFSPLTIFLLILKKTHLIPQTNIILAPEGELSDGALSIKTRKKKSFLKFANFTGLYKKLIWKITSEQEKKDTKRLKGKKIFFQAPNISSPNLLNRYCPELKPKKIRNNAKMIFLSRFMQTKNFGWLVDNLKNIEGTLEIDIYGPIEDKDYWKETQKKIERLPDNIKINYQGEVIYEQVIETLSKYQFFILPTLGENFGHVFIEALAAGCPIIISNRTPWLELEAQGIGWDIALETPVKWLETINYCIKLDEVTYGKLSRNARDFASQWLNDPINEENTLTVLNYSLEDRLDS